MCVYIFCCCCLFGYLFSFRFSLVWLNVGRYLFNVHALGVTLWSWLIAKSHCQRAIVMRNADTSPNAVLHATGWRGSLNARDTNWTLGYPSCPMRRLMGKSKLKWYWERERKAYVIFNIVIVWFCFVSSRILELYIVLVVTDDGIFNFHFQPQQKNAIKINKRNKY